MDNYYTVPILLLNLGCFLFLSSSSSPFKRRRKKLSTISPSTPTPPSRTPSIEEEHVLDDMVPPPLPKRTTSFASRADAIFPCTACGEVFNRSQLLDLHQATTHVLSELKGSESGRDIVKIIFESGWGHVRVPDIERVLKVQHGARTLARFEEHRQAVRSRAAIRAGAGGRKSDQERCIADGNERLRFYCTTYICSLGTGGNLGTCGSPFCSTCEIVRNGFAGKAAEADGGVGTHATGSAAHAALPEGLEEDFSFLHVRRAMLICRVLAGRSARAGLDEPAGAGNEYDSVSLSRGGSEELVVFNPKAVLPCFIVIYRTTA